MRSMWSLVHKWIRCIPCNNNTSTALLQCCQFTRNLAPTAFIGIKSFKRKFFTSRTFILFNHCIQLLPLSLGKASTVKTKVPFRYSVEMNSTGSAAVTMFCHVSLNCDHFLIERMDEIHYEPSLPSHHEILTYRLCGNCLIDPAMYRYHRHCTTLYCRLCQYSHESVAC